MFDNDEITNVDASIDADAADDSEMPFAESAPTPVVAEWKRRSWMRTRDAFYGFLMSAPIDQFSDDDDGENAWRDLVFNTQEQLAQQVARVLNLNVKAFNLPRDVQVLDVFADGPTVHMRTSLRNTDGTDYPLSLDLGLDISIMYPYMLERRAHAMLQQKGHEVKTYNVYGDYGKALVCTKCGAVGRLHPDDVTIDGDIMRPCTK